MAARTFTMRWLTLEDIKEQIRIEPDNPIDDNLLTRYGATAENFTLNYLQRTEDELKAMNKKDPTHTTIPDEIFSACILLVDLYYQHRGPISAQNMYLIDYGYDALVMQYRKGTYSSEENDNV